MSQRLQRTMKQALDLRDPTKQGKMPLWACCGTGEDSGNRESDELQVNDEIAAKFTALSVQEREAVLEEIHGVAPDNDETPERIVSALAEMKAEIANTPIRNKKAFLRAAFLRPSLENDDALHLRFLRAERYDPKEAAAKFCFHFDAKSELFPPEALHRRITIDDFDKDDLAAMKQCSFHPLRAKDQSGRAVLAVVLDKIDFNHWKNQVRYMFYQLVAMMDDEETQKKGVVDLAFLIGMTTLPTKALEMVRGGGHILTNFAIRRCGMHVCYDSSKVHPFFSFLHNVAPKESQVRQRFHYGSFLECQYALRTYGIVLDNFASNDADTYAPVDFSQYFMERQSIDRQIRQKELEPTDSGLILYPQPTDILVGRGRPYQEYIGNVQLVSTVSQYVDEYSSTDDKMEKTLLSLQIVKNIQSRGSRFLKRKEAGWEVVDDTIARQKVVQALRVRARKKKQRGTDDEIVYSSKRMRMVEVK